MKCEYSIFRIMCLKWLFFTSVIFLTHLLHLCVRVGIHWRIFVIYLFLNTRQHLKRKNKLYLSLIVWKIFYHLCCVKCEFLNVKIHVSRSIPSRSQRKLKASWKWLLSGCFLSLEKSISGYLKKWRGKNVWLYYFCNISKYIDGKTSSSARPGSELQDSVSDLR